jgi:hypothetical protein
MSLLVIDELDWNGSWLGTYTDSIVIKTVKAYPFSICYIYIEGLMETGTWVAKHQSKSAYPCIIDEIKTVFGMVKIGTHSITIKGKLYIIYNTMGPPMLLSNIQYSVTPEMKLQVQDTFVFRMIVGLNCNFESSICIVGGVPTSYRNRIDVNSDDGGAISNLMLNKWFTDSMRDSIKRMIAPSSRTWTARQRIQAVINRIDPQLIWIDNVIFDQMMKIG